MVHGFFRFGDGSTGSATTAEQVCELVTRARHDAEATWWVDFDTLDDEAIGLLDDCFGFHPLAIEDVMHEHQRPKIELYEHAEDDVFPHGAALRASRDGGVAPEKDDRYAFVIFHELVPPVRDSEGNEPDRVLTRELDIFLGRSFLVTISRDPIRPVQEMVERLSRTRQFGLTRHPDELLHVLLDRIVDGTGPILDRLRETVDDLEDEAVLEPAPGTLERVGHVKRQLLDLRRIIYPQRDLVASIVRGDVPFVSEQTRVYFRDVHDHLVRAGETIETQRELILGARDVYLSSVSNNLNQTMKTLTLISVIALPATVITSFFGMNFEDLPGLRTTGGVWIAVGMIVASILGLLLYLGRRRVL